MAGIQGTNIVAPVVPLDTADVHPTHEALYGKGGYRTVATTAERDAIPSARREAGMLVYVVANGLRYELGADLSTWTAYAGAVGATGPAGGVGATGPTGAAGTTTWAGITDKPSTFAPSSHASSHAAAGSDPITVGTVADRIVVTTTGGKLATASRLITTQVQHDSGTQLSSIDSLIVDAGSYGLDTAITLHVAKGTTSETVCVGNDSRLSDARTPTSHTHGNLSNLGQLASGTMSAGSVGGPAVFDVLTGSIARGAFGTAAGEVCQGNDSRLSDARTPTDGSVTTAKIASSAVTVAKLSATGAASASTFLRGDGAWAAAGSTSASDLTSGTLPEGRLPNLVIVHPFLLAGM